MKNLYLLVTAFLLALSSISAKDIWEPIGPYGAHITELVETDSSFFAATKLGFYTYFNGAQKWQLVEELKDFEDVYDIDQSNNIVIVSAMATRGCIRTVYTAVSYDYGKNWEISSKMSGSSELTGDTLFANTYQGFRFTTGEGQNSQNIKD